MLSVFVNLFVKGFIKGCNLTASIGVTSYQPGQTVEEILSCVDQALYQAKNDGRDRVKVFNEKQM